MALSCGSANPSTGWGDEVEEEVDHPLTLIPSVRAERLHRVAGRID
jgi:hypothetical protein